MQGAQKTLRGKNEREPYCESSGANKPCLKRKDGITAMVSKVSFITIKERTDGSKMGSKTSLVVIPDTQAYPGQTNDTERGRTMTLSWQTLTHKVEPIAAWDIPYEGEIAPPQG